MGPREKIQCALWVGLVELKPFKREPGEPAGAYTNIVTWAASAKGFREKAETIAATLDRFVVEVEDVEPLEERSSRSELTEEIQDMALRAETNPDAIIYGTFFTYPYDEA